jgi:hypothetical protein
MKKTSISILILFILFIVSCEKNDDPGSDGPEHYKISGTISEDGNYAIDLYALTDTLFEGYNRMFISLINKESGNPVTEAGINLKPMMNMVGMKHAAPCEDPGEMADEEGYFEGAVVFIMPSNPDEGWELGLDLNISGTETSAKIEIPGVIQPEEPVLVKFISAIDQKKYFVSCVQPANPKVGINDCEFTIHYKESMMSFPAAKDLGMEIEPEMPSMEHGSPNNVNPIHVSEGHYEGKLNFTMTGWWRVHLTFKKGNDLLSDDTYMDITF